MRLQRVCTEFIRKAGERVSLTREGETLDRGWAILRPLLDGEEQFLPPRLGVRRVETFRCVAEAGLGVPETPGRGVLRLGDEAYDVVNVRPEKLGAEHLFWEAALRRRQREEAGT